LATAFGPDGPCRVELVEAEGLTAGLGLLRRSAFDAVVIEEPGQGLTPGRLVEAIRTGAHPRLPIVLLGEIPDSLRATQYLEAGADAYLVIRWTTARELLWHLARAVERARLTEENQRLRQRDERQRSLEREEAVRLVAEQTELVAACRPGQAADDVTRPHAWLARDLDELLRAYVLMGHGHLTEELSALQARLRRAALPLSTVLEIYLRVLQRSLLDLGARSSRHVLNRGHLLLVQLLLITFTESADETLHHHSDFQRAGEHSPVAQTAG
jgi:DNA-binding NarL/FixJ family response regulator